MSTYDLCKLKIKRGKYVKSDMQNKLDAFLLSGSLTREQYDELVSMMS